jgi:putative ATP-dependent endonuclease of OLD family
VLTDGDPTIKVTGARRKELLVEQTGGDPDAIFVGATTFEHDLVLESSSNCAAIVSVLTDLLDSDAADDLATVATWAETTPDQAAFLAVIATVGGKGRFAQRLATARLQAPTHLAAALSYLLEQ